MKQRLAVALALLVVAWVMHASQRPSNGPTVVAEKRAHLAVVLAELESAPVDHLTESQRTRRTQVLASLRDYAQRGAFTFNSKLPQYALPYFIDEYGTRCALAHAVDVSGEPGLIEALAHEDNHAYVAHLTGDVRLASWLERHGLTIDDAAFIQAPSIVDDGGGDGFGNPQMGPSDEEVERPEQDEGHDTPADTGGAAPGNESGGGNEAGPRRPRGSTDLGSWQLWWRSNRDAYLSLRGRYHGDATARRPGAETIGKQLVPLFRSLSGGTDELRASAIMAAAMATDGDDAVVDATLDYLKRPESQYRDLMLLALGHCRHARADAALLGIAQDTGAGRAALGKKSGIPERTRAFALLALAETGNGAHVEPITDLLARTKGGHDDLRTAAITTMGILGSRAPEAAREECVTLLRKQLKRERWPTKALAAIPAALVRTDARADVVRLVGRFRGDREVRSAAALALGTFSPELDAKTLDALMASARRDPDLQTRRYAALAVGELCSKSEADAKLRKKLRRFYLGTLDGHFKQPGAMAWHLLSAGLFVRAYPEDGTKIRKRLVTVATRGKQRGERSAAVLALGLSGHADGKETLRSILNGSKDVQLRGAAAEALGMLGDASQRETLLKLALEAPSDALRYQAALALGYLADPSVVPALTKALETTRSAPARAALTRVLGQLGDKRAIDDLVRIASDANNPRPVRERALGALGLIARDADESWTLPYRRGASLPLTTPSVRMMLFIF
ncbi:MAG: HEAT repeat domain-containing protein [Planctomycetota bacterium]